MIAEIIQRESVKDTDNPNDAGGRTKYGISSKWHPELWKDGPPTLKVAQDTYFQQYIVGPKIHLIAPDYLMIQVADFGVLSGPGTAIMHLQGLLNVKQDGDIGPATLEAIKARNPESLNNLLVIDRIFMLVRLAQKRPSDLSNLFGWVRRASTFLRT